MVMRWRWYRAKGALKCFVLGHKLRVFETPTNEIWYCERCPFQWIERRRS